MYVAWPQGFSEELELLASRGADREGFPGTGASRSGAPDLYPFDRDGPGRPVRIGQPDAAIALPPHDNPDRPPTRQLPTEADPLSWGDAE